MSIASDFIRGNTDTIILAHLEMGDSYGYQINKAVATATNGAYEFKEATLYSAFRRLEEQGCIRSYWGEENLGARRRYYAITETGRVLLATLREDWHRSKELIDTLTEEK